MNVDNKTAPNYVNICISNTKEHIKEMTKLAEENGINDEEKSYMQFDSNNCTGNEYYFEDGEIQISCEAVTEKGNASIYLNIKLSDELLIDILHHSIKRFNKLKSVLETLK